MALEKIVQLHRKFAPDLIHTMEDRYNILRNIRYNEPIGRRALAGILGIGERAVRVQVDFLKEAGLVEFSLMGMRVTPEGEASLQDIGEYVRLLHGFSSLEQELSQKLGIKRVIVIPGDSDTEPMVQRELGRVAAGVLAEYLKDHITIAVSGGSTMAMIAEGIYVKQPTTTVVAARGGLGEKMEYQANTIAARMAAKLGGSYRLLHVPEVVSEQVAEAILTSDSNLPAVAQMIKKADILVHSIGRAEKMALRRGLDKQTVQEILRRGAVGETLGHYCTLAGKPVYVTNSVGLRLEDLSGVGTVIAVAGGRDKAEAIVAVVRAGRQDVLVLDEAAALAIRDLCRC